MTATIYAKFHMGEMEFFLTRAAAEASFWDGVELEKWQVADEDVNVFLYGGMVDMPLDEFRQDWNVALNDIQDELDAAIELVASLRKDLAAKRKEYRRLFGEGQPDA